MLNIKVVELSTSVFNYLPLNAFVLSIIAFQTAYFLYLTFYPWQYQPSISFLSFINYLDSFSNLAVIGQSLFLFYFFPFLLTGAVLLVAMIGSILLTLYHQLSLRRQNIFRQNSVESWRALTRHS
jgi:NADH-quinone oxidoreductase subunit J